MRQHAHQAYLFWEIRLREATMESTYTSATEGGICRMSTAHGTSNLHTITRIFSAFQREGEGEEHWACHLSCTMHKVCGKVWHEKEASAACPPHMERPTCTQKHDRKCDALWRGENVKPFGVDRFSALGRGGKNNLRVRSTGLAI